MWGVVSSVVETIVTNIIDARVNEASSRLATCKTKAEAASAYTENVDGAAKQVKDALWEKLTDPETWGGATALLKSVAEKAEDVTENATDLAAGLATIVVGPITERILKAFPPNPAQLVTGQELVGALNAIQRAAVPAQFRGGAGKVGGPSASSLRTQIDPDELPQTGPNGAHIVDSDESRTVRGSDGTAHYVAFRCGGLKVWGYLNAVGIWMPERVDEEEMVADAGKWLGRRITADGYREGGNLVKGKWHKPWRDHSAYVLRRDDGILEAAGAPQATEAGGDFRNSVGGLLEGRAAGPGADFIVPNA